MLRQGNPHTPLSTPYVPRIIRSLQEHPQARTKRLSKAAIRSAVCRVKDLWAWLWHGTYVPNCTHVVFTSHPPPSPVQAEMPPTHVHLPPPPNCPDADIGVSSAGLTRLQLQQAFGSAVCTTWHNHNGAQYKSALRTGADNQHC